MGKRYEAAQLLALIAKHGYFLSASYNPSAFCDIVENKLDISSERAIDILRDAGLATLEFSTDSDIHPREMQEYWRVALLPAGIELLKQV